MKSNGNSNLPGSSFEESSHLLKQVSDCLSNKDFIDFALIFGSYANKSSNNMSDIDIGLFLNIDIPLLEVGSITSEIESAVKRNADIVILNNLYKKRPLFAYQIITNCEIIICKDHDRLTEFRKNTFLYYFDMKHLSEEANINLRKRINSNKFGKRNYAGTR